MGCGWKRWTDEVDIERLMAVQAAWQENTTVFAKVMRGTVCGVHNLKVSIVQMI
jgi:hypothetical protein